MRDSEGLQNALGNSGLTPADFATITPFESDKVGYTPVRHPGMIGAVATWKFEPAHMAYLPSGAVWMSSQPKETTKKSEVFSTLEKSSGTILQKEISTLADTLELKFGRKPSNEEVKSLLLGNAIKNGSKELKLDAKFYTFAYGACMNPSVGMEVKNYTLIEDGK